MISRRQNAPGNAWPVSAGLTMVEMLVAMTASLVLLGAVTAVFQVMGDAVAASRRLGWLDQQLDTVITRLMLDLHGATADADPNGLKVASETQNGYFEIVEGPSTDYEDYSTGTRIDRSTAAAPANRSDDRIVGDVDDMLFFTTVTVTPELFVGKWQTQNDTAETAEVAYFCRPTPNTSNPQLYTLYRRQVLVRGLTPLPPFTPDGTYPGAPGTTPVNWSAPAAAWQAFYQNFDVSVRRQGSVFVLNGLDELQRRQNRLAHDLVLNTNASPPPVAVPIAAGNPALALLGPREGEDVLLTNVLAFDVRVLDPDVVIHRQGAVRLTPSDPGYWAAAAMPLRGPQYVDLGYGHSLAANAPEHSRFSRLGPAVSPGNPVHPLKAPNAAAPRTFDTWSSLDGPAPYAESLPGISVTVRLYDPAARRVRQATLNHVFSR